MSFSDLIPASHEETRKRLFDGEIFLARGNSASLALVDAVTEELHRELGAEFRLVHEQYSETELFERVGKLRKKIYTTSQFHFAVNRVIESLGFDLQQETYDPARIRVVSHLGHQNPAAAPIYHGHRDTWYANGESMITWWIPIHDVTPQETFEFFPEFFQQPVKNNSEVFSFQSWTSKGQDNRIGWQNKETSRVEVYPSLQQTVEGTRIGVAASRGDILLFSGQHLHQTVENCTGKTRFSIDFRTINSNDFASGAGPGNVDNRSQGASFKQFIKPTEVQ